MGELLGYWVALAFYAVGFITAASGLVLKSRFLMRFAVMAVVAGLLGHTVSLVSRGIVQWSPPFITYYESISFGTWLATGMFFAFARAHPSILPALVVLAPINLILMGAAMFDSREMFSLEPALQTWWLVVHVLFAMLAFGCMLVAVGVGVVMIIFPRARWAPPREKVDRLLFQAFSLAFIFQLVMVASGSIWANQAWGRFWGWDPIETFSLLTLAVLGTAVHLRLVFNWRGRSLAWLSVIGFLLTVYGAWGVPMVSKSIHLYQAPQGQHP